MGQSYMTTENEARNELKAFESFLANARYEKYAGYPEKMKERLLKATSLTQWDLLALYDQYERADIFPPERLGKLVYYLMDVKLQLYYLMEVDLGLHNILVYNHGYENKKPRAKPHVFLTRLSLDQSLILKSRILWERIMNLLYFIETGEELENKINRRKSKRAVFFQRMLSKERWLFLEPYGPLLEDYEKRYRSPESHKKSILRAELMGNVIVDPNELLRLINEATNSLWTNLFSIVGGGHAYSFTSLHFNENGEVDPKYIWVNKEN